MEKALVISEVLFAYLKNNSYKDRVVGVGFTFYFV